MEDNVTVPRTFDFSAVNSTAPTPVHVLNTVQVLNLVPQDKEDKIG